MMSPSRKFFQIPKFFKPCLVAGIFFGSEFFDTRRHENILEKEVI